MPAPPDHLCQQPGAAPLAAPPPMDPSPPPSTPLATVQAPSVHGKAHAEPGQGIEDIAAIVQQARSVGGTIKALHEGAITAGGCLPPTPARQRGRGAHRGVLLGKGWHSVERTVGGGGGRQGSPEGRAVGTTRAAHVYVMLTRRLCLL